MPEVYFHYSDAEHIMAGAARPGAAVQDMAEARAHAHRLVRSLITTPSAEDWRDWVLYATDERGEEIFVLPFATILGKPH